jgi:ribosomal protein L11 methyltransferase
MVELCLLAPADRVDAVGDALMEELGSLSVSVEDADAGTEAERPLFGEPGMGTPDGWTRSTVRALFEDEAGASTAAALLLAQPWAAQVEVRSLAAVPDQDWVRLTQSQFAPVEITPSFWIVPSWHEPPEGAHRVIRLDPGLAFGTGTHPTTRMCLRWIAQQAPQSAEGWRRVLDYGCGSGILAIGASLHGAQSVDAVDIDPAAVQSTVDNASANQVSVCAGLPNRATGRYDLLLANILATPLKLLAPLLCGHIAPGGSLVLAGILDRQTEELRAAYAPWIEIEMADVEDGWALMTGRMRVA